VSWSVFAISHAPIILGIVLGVAFLVTFSPPLMRALLRTFTH